MLLLFTDFNFIFPKGRRLSTDTPIVQYTGDTDHVMALPYSGRYSIARIEGSYGDATMPLAIFLNWRQLELCKSILPCSFRHCNRMKEGGTSRS